MKDKKFNVIDVLIVLVLVAALAFGAYKMLPKGSADPGESGEAETVETDFRFTVRADEVSEDLADSIVASLENDEKDGLYRQIYNSDTLQDAHIVLWDVQETDNGCTLIFTIDAHERITGVENHTVGTQEIRLGKSYLLKTLDVELNTIVVGMEKLDG